LSFDRFGFPAAAIFNSQLSAFSFQLSDFS
jgi:hypothetical protein